MKHFADLLLKKNNSKTNDQIPFIQRRRGIEIKSAREINLMKKSSRIVATVLRDINDLIKPGMSTKDLDDFAEKRIRSFGAVPSFKGYHGFPSSICSSINNEAAPQCELVSPLPKVRIEIADTGSGISQADQEKIFDRFYRVENSVHTEQGTGLGLSIVRGIIEKHGGEIRMASELGVGTTFWFDLALAQSDKDELLTKALHNSDSFSGSEIKEIF